MCGCECVLDNGMLAGWVSVRLVAAICICEWMLDGAVYWNDLIVSYIPVSQMWSLSVHAAPANSVVLPPANASTPVSVVTDDLIVLTDLTNLVAVSL